MNSDEALERACDAAQEAAVLAIGAALKLRGQNELLKARVRDLENQLADRTSREP